MLRRQAEADIINKKANVSWNAESSLVYVIRGQIALKATEDKIIILLDKFRTGYECKTCDGEGYLDKCPGCSGAGLNRFQEPCKVCSGIPESFVNKQCVDCKGNGSLIVVPDHAKSIPTTGVIVSVGPACKYRQVGERVLFGAHVGYILPLKGNVRLRIMREHEPMADVFLIDTQDNKLLSDFIMEQQPIDNS